MFFAKSCIRALHTLAECISKKEWSKAYSLLSKDSKELEHLDPSLISSLMWGFNTSNRATEAWTLIKLMHDLEKEPEELVYIAAIEVCMRAGKTSETLSLFYDTQLYDLSLDSALYEELIGFLIKKDNLEGVKKAFFQLRKDKINPSFTLCVKLAKYASKKEDEELIQKLNETIKEIGYKPPEKENNLGIKNDFRKKQNNELSNGFFGKLENGGDLEKFKGFIKDLKFLNSEGKNMPFSINIMMRPEDLIENEEAESEINEDELQINSEDDSDSDIGSDSEE